MRVEAGEALEVTNHGRAVARLVPLEHARRSRDELIAFGRLRPGRGNVLDVTPVEGPGGAPGTGELLAELRTPP